MLEASRFCMRHACVCVRLACRSRVCISLSTMPPHAVPSVISKRVYVCAHFASVCVRCFLPLPLRSLGAHSMQQPPLSSIVNFCVDGRRKRASTRATRNTRKSSTKTRNKISISTLKTEKKVVFYTKQILCVYYFALHFFQSSYM